MAKTIVTYCDPHLDREEHVHGESVRQLGRDGKPYDVDMCEEDRKLFADPMFDLIERFGQPVTDHKPAAPERAKVTPSGEKLPCPSCGTGRRSYTTLARLLTHMEKRHGTTLNDAGEIIEVSEETHPHGCPEPTCRRRFRLPQSLGAHRSSDHGYKRGDDDADGSLFAEPGVPDSEGVMVGAAH